jgi:hypothetical protein
MAATAVQEYSGKFEHGGFIPAGKYGVTQEAGFEITHGPTAVSSARSTADMLAGQNQGGNTSVVVNNYTDGTATVEEKQTADGKVIEITIQRVKKELAAEVRQGGSTFARSLEQTYKLNRGAA